MALLIASRLSHVVIAPGNAFMADRAYRQTLVPYEWDIVVISFVLKLLLLPAYKSTDFQVHRNWLAVTGNLPLREWYFDTTSQWTLDYPPFFAYWEWCLAQLAKWLDPNILQLDGLDHNDWSVVVFQRLSVVLSELVLGYACLRLLRLMQAQKIFLPSIEIMVPASLFLHPGLIFIDHIHFQYNGFLIGIFLLSCIAFKEESHCLGAFYFASVLCFKHIFLYVAPAYFFYLLRVKCFPKGWHAINATNCVKLGLATMAPLALAFGPFIITGLAAHSRGLQGRGASDQLQAIVGRLFPFKRGICHALWAANFWALYSAADRLLIYFSDSFKLVIRAGAMETSTRGMTGDTIFGILPEITATMTIFVTLFFHILGALPVLSRPTFGNFLRALLSSAYASFLFGWHVHEKAYLLIVVPLTLLLTEDATYSPAWVLVSLSGTIAAAPLLQDAMSSPLKILILSLYTYTVVNSIRANSPSAPSSTLMSKLAGTLYTSYLYGLGLVHLAYELKVYPKNLPFLPIMITSLYCTIGLISSWLLTFCRASKR